MHLQKFGGAYGFVEEAIGLGRAVGSGIDGALGRVVHGRYLHSACHHIFELGFFGGGRSGFHSGRVAVYYVFISKHHARVAQVVFVEIFVVPAGEGFYRAAIGQHDKGELGVLVLDGADVVAGATACFFCDM